MGASKGGAPAAPPPPPAAAAADPPKAGPSGQADAPPPSTLRARAAAALAGSLVNGSTWWDGVAIVAACQVGQIILVLPRAFWLAGVAPGLLLAVGTAVSGTWTMYVSVALYLEFRQRKIADNSWYDAPCGTKRATTSQYHDVVRHLGGPRWGPAASVVVIVCTATTMFGIAVAQILACATNSYAVSPSLSKRAWAAAWGSLMALCAAVPSFRNARALSFLAAFGTTFTAWFVVAASVAALNDPTRPPPPPVKWWPTTAQGFFVGGSIIGGSMGSHTVLFEVLHASSAASTFTSAFVVGQLYVWTLTLPHSIAANVAFGRGLAAYDSVYGVLPPSPTLAASAWLMNLHQVLVYAFVLMPVFIYAERAARVHTRAFPLRLAVRLPIVAAVLAAALAFPFYGALNALLVSVGVPMLSFVLPCLIYNHVYRDAAARAAAPKPPPLTLGGRVPLPAARTAAATINWVLAGAWLVAGTGFGIYYAVAAIVGQAGKFGLFADCYQCAARGAGAG